MLILPCRKKGKFKSAVLGSLEMRVLVQKRRGGGNFYVMEGFAPSHYKQGLTGFTSLNINTNKYIIINITIKKTGFETNKDFLLLTGFTKSEENKVGGIFGLARGTKFGVSRDNPLVTRLV